VFNKLKSMLYEDDASAPAPAQAPPAQGTSIGTVQMPSSAPSSFGASTLNADMVTAIRKAVFGRNTAFTQLLASSEALADVIPDATMRLKAAHKTGGAGRTGRQIADAVDVHLQDVDGEELRFKTMIEQKLGVEVGALEQQSRNAAAQAVQFSSEIEQLQARVVSLQRDIGEMNMKASGLQHDATTKRAELDGAHAQFKSAAQAVRTELNGSKSAILSTLV